jgi:hypothetical protein
MGSISVMKALSRLTHVLIAGIVTGACATGVAPTSAPSIPPPSQPPVAAVCGGLDADWSHLPDNVQKYVAAWQERDPAERLRLVEEVLTEDGTYIDGFPDQEPPVGQRAVAEYIGALQPAAASDYYEPAGWTPTDLHHDRIRMRWRLCDAKGEVQLIGADIAALDADGRFREIAGFFHEPEPAPQTEDVCTGPDSADWSGLPEIVRRYGDAWMAQSNLDRAAILDEIWADDGYYVNPFVEAPVIGRPALNDHMDYGMGPGQYIEVTSWADNSMHHDRIRIPWRVCCPNGVLLVEGDDIGEIDTEGRLSRVTSFWDNEVALPPDVACG